MQKKFMTYSEKRRVDEFLGTILTVHERNEDMALQLVIYENGWNDRKVAEHLGSNATGPSVRNIRIECHGQTVRRAPGDFDLKAVKDVFNEKYYSIEKAVLEFERVSRERIDNLEARIAVLEGKDEIGSFPSLPLSTPDNRG